MLKLFGMDGFFFICLFIPEMLINNLVCNCKVALVFLAWWNPVYTLHTNLSVFIPYTTTQFNIS